MCAHSSLLGTLSVSLLSSKVSYFLPLSTVPCTRESKRMLAELDSSLVRFSETTQPAHCFTFSLCAHCFTRTAHCFTFYPAFVHTASLALHIALDALYSERWHTGPRAKLQDRGPCKPPRVVTPVFWRNICRLCRNAFLMASAVSQSFYQRWSISFVMCERVVLLHDTWHSWNLSPAPSIVPFLAVLCFQGNV